ncbi:MAG: NUDIX domain-containing protein [Patescibacteria group bacterium]
MEVRLFVAVKGFIRNDGKILLIRESATYKDGTRTKEYDLPGGRITPGEDLKKALAREALEETGLHVAVGDPFFVSDAEPKPVVRGETWHIVRTFFACDASGTDIHLSEDHDEYVWIDPLKYRDYPVIENLFSAFDAYLKRTGL